MSRTFDAEEALDIMTQVTQMNDDENRITLYVILCPEHGGFVCRNAMEAITTAQRANTQQPTSCDYYPVAVGLSPTVVQSIFAEPPEAS